jgi:hypothetical protein
MMVECATAQPTIRIGRTLIDQAVAALASQRIDRWNHDAHSAGFWLILNN